MSDAPGRGYLPPSVPSPTTAHRRSWIQPFYPATAQPQVKGQFGVPQTEGIDLSSRPVSDATHNGGDPVNGQVKEASAGVSVIATNPLIQSEDKADGIAPADKPSPTVDGSSPPAAPSRPAHPISTHVQEHAGIPTMAGQFEGKGTPAESQGVPSHPVESKVSSSPSKPDKTENATVPSPPQKQPSAASDHVESLLENMFQSGDDSPVKQSVIVSNSSKAPTLTEDKVVAILEDSTVPDDKTEIKKEGTDIKSSFMEVETALEKMFAGIVEPVKEETDEPTTGTYGEPKKRKIRRSVGPGRKPRKSTDDPNDGQPLKRGRKPKLDGRGRGGKRLRRESNLTKDGSNDSSLLVMRRGPFIHIEGPKDAPTYISIFNNGAREDEERDRSHKSLDKLHPRKKLVEGWLNRSGLYSSTLSSKYNSVSADITWVCIFCKMRPHCENGLGGEPAGDLFGPYMIKINPEDVPDPRAPPEREIVTEQKRRGSGKQASLRAAGVADQFVKDLTKKNKKLSNVDDPAVQLGEREIWVHEKCAVWAPGVLLVGAHLIGLAEAVSAASVTKCSSCGLYGASMGCVVHKCPVRCHYGCAVRTNWNLDQMNFIAKCPNHTTKSQQRKSGGKL